MCFSTISAAMSRMGVSGPTVIYLACHNIPGFIGLVSLSGVALPFHPNSLGLVLISVKPLAELRQRRTRPARRAATSGRERMKQAAIASAAACAATTAGLLTSR